MSRWILIMTSCIIFFVSLHPVVEYDTFFGIKIGERIMQTKSIDPTEVFSWSAAGRQGNLYEWLAQVWIYSLHQIGGFTAISWYVASITTLFFIIMYLLQTTVFKRDWISGLLLSILCIAGIYEFCVARPQIISFVCVLLLIYVIWKPTTLSCMLTLPMMYLWTNSHASFMMGIALLCIYTEIYWFLNKKDIAKLLAITTLLDIFVTLLPPVSFQPYRLLWEFMADGSFLRQFISEWGPITSSPYLTVLYGSLVLMTIGISVFALQKTKEKTSPLMLTPLYFIMLMSLSAIRHIPYGVICSILILGMSLPEKEWTKKYRIFRIMMTIGVVILSGWLIREKRDDISDRYREMPNGAVQFLKTHHITGNMFNQFGIGGFLIYHLYPQYHVFFDGRAEVYRTHEMRAFYPILTAGNAPQERFTRVLTDFLDTYQFSFVILPISSHNPTKPTVNERMADTLLDLPQWHLLFLDDQSMIFIKDDGKNDIFIQSSSHGVITPYRTDLFKKNQEQRAEIAYTTLLHWKESSIGLTGLGEAQYTEKKFDEAKQSLRHALQLDPTNGYAYMALGLIAKEQSLTPDAIRFFRTAVTYAPYLGRVYKELAQIYIAGHDADAAQKIITEGLGQSIDLLSRQSLIQLLPSLSK